MFCLTWVTVSSRSLDPFIQVVTIYIKLVKSPCTDSIQRNTQISNLVNPIALHSMQYSKNILFAFEFSFYQLLLFISMFRSHSNCYINLFKDRNTYAIKNMYIRVLRTLRQRHFVSLGSFQICMRFRFRVKICLLVKDLDIRDPDPAFILIIRDLHMLNPDLQSRLDNYCMSKKQ